MDGSAVLTYGLGGALVGAFIAGVVSIGWLNSKFRILRNDLISEIKANRTETDAKADELHTRIDGVQQNLTTHQLHVAEHFMPQKEILAQFAKLELALNNGFDKLEARFVRMEGKVEP